LDNERAAVGNRVSDRVGDLPEGLRRVLGGNKQRGTSMVASAARSTGRSPPLTSAMVAGPLSANICLIGSGNPSHAVAQHREASPDPTLTAENDATLTVNDVDNCRTPGAA
jgi:hypothetical protein